MTVELGVLIYSVLVTHGCGRRLAVRRRMHLQRGLGREHDARPRPHAHRLTERVAREHAGARGDEDDICGIADREGSPDPIRRFSVGMREHGAASTRLEDQFEPCGSANRGWFA
jgi:hypothetical protein